MRKTIATILLTFSVMTVVSVRANAQSHSTDRNLKDVTSIQVEDVVVNNPTINHSGRFIQVEMELDLTGLKVRQNRAVLLTPHIVGDLDSLDLPSVGVYGRRRYYYYERKKQGFITENEESYRVRRKPRKPDTIEYSQVVDYMEFVGSGELELHLRRGLYGCCGRLKEEIDSVLFTEAPFFHPELIYVIPPKVVKERSLSGSANIEYVLDKTDVRPDFRNNAAELHKITAMIDATMGDSDVTIQKVFLKGYASPEGTYAHNTELAKGRVESLKDYVSSLYRFEPGMVVSEYEPEDWEGFREFVVASDRLPHRDGILAIIDSDMDIDGKEWKIHQTYPEDYKYLLEYCYPTLRHTYYEVFYNVREYTSLDEIKQIYASSPGKLSLPEFYLLADELEPGSEEFVTLFDLTVRLFPSDPVANLNAANAAIRCFNFTKAGAYLDKAGDSPEAEYARGVRDYWDGAFDNALVHFRNAYDGGVTKAADLIEVLQTIDRGTLEASRRSAIRDALARLGHGDAL